MESVGCRALDNLINFLPVESVDRWGYRAAKIGVFATDSSNSGMTKAVA